ncbi:MAG: dioxygenase [Alphaproteobacteria bacterium]|nr:dioxygenase [Alphaproteobacteria bacterium]
MIPAVFVSHGAPTLLIEEDPVKAALVDLGRVLPRPKAVLCVSAHWESPAPLASRAPRPETIHDFFGFPRELYELRYPAPGAPDLARRVAGLVPGLGLDAERGLDHGAWVPLMLMYPEADIPATQLSIQHPLGPAHHLALGKALAPLREDGVLILASGSATHNLGALAWGGDEVPAWAREFDDWLDAKIASGAVEDLTGYRARAPHAVAAHPRDEHLLPLFVALGAATGPGRANYRGFSHGALSMAAYVWP